MPYGNVLLLSSSALENALDFGRHAKDAPPGRVLVGGLGFGATLRGALDKHAPEIVLTDINLPGLSGIGLVRQGKLGLTNTQFVMLTIYEDSNHIFEALSAGATGYLSKRTPREALITALREVNAGGSPMSSSIARKVVQSFQRKTAKAEAIEELSKRENEVLELLAQGHTYKHIADAMNVGMATVSTYTRRIYEKLQVNSRGQAVAIYADLAEKKKTR